MHGSVLDAEFACIVGDSTRTRLASNMDLTFGIYEAGARYDPACELTAIDLRQHGTGSTNLIQILYSPALKPS